MNVESIGTSSARGIPGNTDPITYFNIFFGTKMFLTTLYVTNNVMTFYQLSRIFNTE